MAPVDGIVAPLTATPVELSAAGWPPRSIPSPSPAWSRWSARVRRLGPALPSSRRPIRPPTRPLVGLATAVAAGPAADGADSAARRAVGGPVELEVPRVPITDSYSHRLVAGRRLYDHGAAVQSIPALAGLVAASPLRVNPHDLDDLGRGRRWSGPGPDGPGLGRGRGRCPTRPCPAGWWPSTSTSRWAGGRPADLIDASLPVTELRMETP